MTPTARTLAWLREQGHTCGVVERNTLVMERHESGRVSKRFHKNDLFGFIDVVSLDGEHTIGWQATSGAHVAERVAKIQAHENLPAVLRAGWRVRVIGWTKYAKPVDRRRWRERVVEVTGGDNGD